MNPKPRLRLRSGRWICSGRGHVGSGKTIAAAWCGWQYNRTIAESMAFAARTMAAGNAQTGAEVSTYVRLLRAAQNAPIAATVQRIRGRVGA